MRRGSGQKVVAGAYLAAATTATVVTAAGSANTKGAWTEIVAAQSFDGVALTLSIGWPDTATAYLIDVAIGDATNKRVVIPDLVYQTAQTSGGQSSHWPLVIPSGLKVYARIQAAVASATLALAAQLHGGGSPRAGGGAGRIPSRWLAYGADLSTSLGKQIDPGGSANTKGAWTPLAAMNTGAFARRVIMAAHNAELSPSVGFALDLAWRLSAGQERYLVRDMVMSNALPIRRTWHSADLPVDLADVGGGAELVARAQCSSATSPNRLLYVAAYLAEA